MKNFLYLVVGGTAALVVWFDFVHVNKNAEPGAEYRAGTSFLRSETEQIKSKIDLFNGKLQFKKAEQDYQGRDSALDFKVGFLAKQQKEEDLREVEKVMAAMASDVSQVQRVQKQLEALLTSGTGVLIARDERLVRFFDQIHSQKRLSPDDILFYLKEAKELRDEMQKEDPTKREDTRQTEMARLHSWESASRSAQESYQLAGFQVQALAEEARNTPFQGKATSLAKAIDALKQKDAHDRLFPQGILQGGSTHHGPVVVPANELN